MKGTGNRNTMLMTEGNILPILLSFAVPLFLGNIFQHFYNLFDTMVAGYALGDSAIAAIGATSSLSMFLINMSHGLNSGYGIVLSQRFGAGDREGMRKALGGTFLLDAVTMVVVSSLGLLAVNPLLTVMNVPQSIFPDTSAYLKILLIGFSPTLLYNMCASILRAFGNSRTALLFLMFSSVLNIILDYVFVVFFHMGVPGEAWATVIAQSISALLSILYLLRNYGEYLPRRSDISFSNKELVPLFSLGSSMALMYSVVDLGTIAFQKANNLLGPTYITAHTVARNIVMFLMSPISTLGNADATFVGQNYGAGRVDRVRKGLRYAMSLCVVWTVFANVVAWGLGRPLVSILINTTDQKVLSSAVLSLRWHVSFFFILIPVLNIRSAMQAVGRKLVPVLSSCIELVLKFLSAFYLIPRIGFIGSCMTEPLVWCAMCVFLVTFYLRLQSSQSGKEL